MPSHTTNFSWNKPTDGADNDVWGDYLNGNLDSQDTLVRQMINHFIANSAPSVAQSGTFWINNTTNPWVLSVYDGTNWCSIGTISTTNHTFTPSNNTSFYIGDYKYSAQTTNHGSWLLCNGQSVSTTTYSSLFSLIGYAFGGSGANFNVPDLRGQVAGGIGQGTYSGASTRTLGQFVGEETHVLTVNEMPSHSHVFNPWSDSATDGVSPATAVGVSDRINTVMVNNSIFILPTGGGAAHNNIQPTLFGGNYFIYSGV